MHSFAFVYGSVNELNRPQINHNESGVEFGSGILKNHKVASM